jgi:hypothetical protein
MQAKLPEIVIMAKLDVSEAGKDRKRRPQRWKASGFTDR